ncbi:winged helix-turn-helix transcriptional regulator [Vibrio splendidus]|uniref:winged helix-turn-helix transcriptional regulator n=1 Tax=Vibrio TaxID=662 RepID=UPI00030002C1|nr:MULTISPECIES: helix-turn-helix domain-containing protein [Vibrio]OEF51767.1 HxlR family transcriptional regulator [Vibrio cyclitrophicus 1F273]OEF69477.1 HxlR family transcriptional regulator [Vibrio splendidus 1F-157]PMI50413.1 HxlR family transcriptional regulator [Vibrio splendidus]PMO90371.1 HxlR family transcriptional regulator [Vibrio splendidus]PMP27985.1 HxlR family transcriptional regulator [Vibrio splendidus]
MKKQKEIEQQLGLDLCPTRTILAQISDKWSLIVIIVLGNEEYRFSELAKKIPDISQRMLTQTLRKLERDGLLQRRVTPSIPPRVDYKMTTLGQSLSEPLNSMSKWALDNQPHILVARDRFDKANTKHLAEQVS